MLCCSQRLRLGPIKASLAIGHTVPLASVWSWPIRALYSRQHLASQLSSLKSLPIRASARCLARRRASCSQTPLWAELFDSPASSARGPSPSAEHFTWHVLLLFHGQARRMLVPVDSFTVFFHLYVPYAYLELSDFACHFLPFRPWRHVESDLLFEHRERFPSSLSFLFFHFATSWLATRGHSTLLQGVWVQLPGCPPAPTICLVLSVRSLLLLRTASNVTCMASFNDTCNPSLEWAKDFLGLNPHNRRIGIIFRRGSSRSPYLPYGR